MPTIGSKPARDQRRAALATVLPMPAFIAECGRSNRTFGSSADTLPSPGGLTALAHFLISACQFRVMVTGTGRGAAGPAAPSPDESGAGWLVCSDIRNFVPSLVTT